MVILGHQSIPSQIRPVVVLVLIFRLRGPGALHVTRCQIPEMLDTQGQGPAGFWASRTGPDSSCSPCDRQAWWRLFARHDRRNIHAACSLDSNLICRLLGRVVVRCCDIGKQGISGTPQDPQQQYCHCLHARRAGRVILLPDATAGIQHFPSLRRIRVGCSRCKRTVRWRAAYLVHHVCAKGSSLVAVSCSGVD